MRRGRARRVAPLAGAAVLVAFTLARASSSSPAATKSADWPGHGYDLSNWAWNARETEVRGSTAHRLALKWRFPVNEMVATTPAVVNGTVYFGSWEGIVYAVDAVALGPSAGASTRGHVLARRPRGRREASGSAAG
jgi:hypothetical protein